MSRAVAVLSDSWLLRLSLTRIASVPPLEVAAEVEDPATLEAGLRAADAELVIAAASDTQCEPLIGALKALPAPYRAMVLLVPSAHRVHAPACPDEIVCLPLDADRETLKDGLRHLIAGEPLRVRGNGDGPAPEPGFGLTPREHEILQALAHEGLTNREIADRFVLSGNTVKTHLRKIFRKLDADTRAEAVAKYLRTR